MLVSLPAVVCKEPPVTNADILDIRDVYTHNSVVHYACRWGTLVGQQSISCTKNGTWSSPPPTCQGSDPDTALLCLNSSV